MVNRIGVSHGVVAYSRVKLMIEMCKSSEVDKGRGEP